MNRYNNGNKLPAAALPLAICLSIAAIFLFHTLIIDQELYNQFINNMVSLRTDINKIIRDKTSKSKKIPFVIDEFKKRTAEILLISQKGKYFETNGSMALNFKRTAEDFSYNAVMANITDNPDKPINLKKTELENAIDEILETADNKFKNKTRTIIKAGYGTILAVCILLISYYFLSYRKMKSQMEKLAREKNKYLETIKEMTQRDFLTNLPGRAKFFEESEKEIASAERYKTELSIIKLDIDHFKAVNHQHGQQIGDRILTEFSRLVRKNLRRTDSLYRLGSDKFIILASHTSEKNAHNLTAKIVDLISNHNFAGSIKLNVSFGISHCKPGDDSSSLLKRVNSALKTSKEKSQGKRVQF